MSRAARRQLIFCSVGLLLLTVLGLKLAQLGQPHRADETRRLPSSPPVFGKSVEVEAAGPAGEAPPAEAVSPPEPWTERPELLELARSADRTSRIEEKALAYFLQRARLDAEGAGGPGLVGLAPQLGANPGEKVFEELLAHPDLHRGKLVALKGNLIGDGTRFALRLIGIDVPNPSGLDRAYQSYLLANGKFYLVATARKRRELEHQDGVEFRGYFAQIYKGQVLLRGELQDASIPLLVGDDYELYKRPVVPQPSLLLIPLAVGLAVAAVILGLFLRRSSKRSFEARRLKARSGHAPSGPTPGEGAPS